jgi:hypothetical protein
MPDRPNPCPTACDPDCEASCHEVHELPWKRTHEVDQHPGRHVQTFALPEPDLSFELTIVEGIRWSVQCSDLGCDCGCQNDGEWHWEGSVGCMCAQRGCPCVIDQRWVAVYETTS